MVIILTIHRVFSGFCSLKDSFEKNCLRKDLGSEIQVQDSGLRSENEGFGEDNSESVNFAGFWILHPASHSNVCIFVRCRMDMKRCARLSLQLFRAST